MYNELPKIKENFDESYFIPLIERISMHLAKENSEITDEQREAFADSYKEQLISLLKETPTVYYQALKHSFDEKNEGSIESYVNVDNFPTDLKVCILEKTPEAMLRFLQYIKEEDVPVISVESATAFYQAEKGEQVAEQTSEETVSEKPEEFEGITPEQYAANLGIPVSYMSKKIGRQAAECAPIGIAVESMVMLRLGLEEFSMTSSPSHEGVAMYNEIMGQISELPAVCYGMLHSVASNRLIPNFYDTRDTNYYDLDSFSPSPADPLEYRRDEKAVGAMLENLLSDAAVGRFTITDPSAATKYFEKYSALELPKRNTPQSMETIKTRIEEGQEDIDKKIQLDKEEKKSVKQASDTRFKFYLNQLKKNGAVCKEEYDFLLKRSKIYAKENAMLDKANDKYMKASIKVEKLHLIDDMRDLTAKERKELSKAMKELDKASNGLEKVKADLLKQNQKRDERDRVKFPEHTKLRQEQIESGDTSYIPLQTREDSLNNKMYSYKAHIYKDAAAIEREIGERESVTAEEQIAATPSQDIPTVTAEVQRTPIPSINIPSVTKQTSLQTVEAPSPDVSKDAVSRAQRETDETEKTN